MWFPISSIVLKKFDIQINLIQSEAFTLLLLVFLLKKFYLQLEAKWMMC